MSRKTADNKDDRLIAELRRVQKAAAVLACIQFTADYDNEVEADLADALAVVLELVTAVATAIDAVLTADGEEE